METLLIDRELTDEGKKIWENLSSYMVLEAGGSVLPKQARPRKIKLSISELENEFFKLEIKRLIRNSKMVIEDCEAILERCSTMHEYIANDAKVAKTVHTNLIERLKRVLDLIPAFDHEIIVD